MTKSQHVNDYLIGVVSWMVSNLAMESKGAAPPPQCRRKMMMQKSLEKQNVVPVKWKWMFSLSQPAHFFTLVTSLYLAFLFFPREGRLTSEQPSTLTSLVYVACFATHFGTQFWMTFASGLVLFFSLPRHIFGRVQRCLFPKYFLCNSLLSAATLALFILHHPAANNSHELRVQIWTLLTCFLSEFSARVYIVPHLLEAMEERMALEENAGVGMEIGRHNPGPLANCPHYNQIDKRFKFYHGICAAANVISMACSTLHLYFLSTRLRTALT
ncbi:hypothetical protein JTE90_026952 [Oedothorax gibbosus]|uniref:TMEM205-like domain-containing protein n=1 Tax=Oedothorax gibbosus TaxID=931172 RepID=A0AAV6UVJ7_9ARAC|nr:hypothetical protein JTE90_026952 [Oedothorax gibbosus]